MSNKEQLSQSTIERVPVKLSRALLALDGKDHFILRNKDFSIFLDTTDPRIVRRSRWVFEEDFEQYWEAEVKTTVSGKKHIKLMKRISDQGWEDFQEED